MSLTPGTRLGPYEIKEGTAEGTAPMPSMVVVLNWLDELKRLLPAK